MNPHLSIFRDPKNSQKSTRAEFLGVSDGVLKTDPVQGSKKWDFAIIYYTWARSNVSKMDPILGPFWGPVFSKKRKKGVPEKA